MKSQYREKSRNVALIPLWFSLSLTGCTSVSQHVPPDVAQRSSPSKVQSSSFSFKDGSFQVGEYSVSRINYGAVQANGVLLGPFSGGASYDGFKFHIGGPRAGWKADCSRKAQSGGLAVNRSQIILEQSNMHCELVSGPRGFTLQLKGVPDSRNGSIQMAGALYSVRQYFAGDGPLGKPDVPRPLGMRIDRDGENVAALAFHPPGTFWINRTLAPDVQDAMAGVLAAMLIEHRRIDDLPYPAVGSPN